MVSVFASLEEDKLGSPRRIDSHIRRQTSGCWTPRVCAVVPPDPPRTRGWRVLTAPSGRTGVDAWHGGGKVGPGFGLRRRARSSGPRFLHLGKGHNPSVSAPQGRREASPAVLRSTPRRAVVIGSLRHRYEATGHGGRTAQAQARARKRVHRPLLITCRRGRETPWELAEVPQAQGVLKSTFCYRRGRAERGTMSTVVPAATRPDVPRELSVCQALLQGQLT